MNVYSDLLCLQSDKVANYLRNFKGSVSEFKEGVVTEDIMDITSETELMIELDDILDELHTLKLVLTDQKSVVQDMNRTLRESDRNASASAHVNTKTLESHLQRIEQMEQAASKAEKTVRITQFPMPWTHEYADPDQAASPR